MHWCRDRLKHLHQVLIKDEERSELLFYSPSPSIAFCALNSSHLVSTATFFTACCWPLGSVRHLNQWTTLWLHSSLSYHELYLNPEDEVSCCLRFLKIQLQKGILWKRVRSGNMSCVGLEFCGIKSVRVAMWEVRKVTYKVTFWKVMQFKIVGNFRFKEMKLAGVLWSSNLQKLKNKALFWIVLNDQKFSWRAFAMDESEMI